MTYLRYVCANDPEDSPASADEHDTDILIVRCVHCQQFAVAGYQCAGCGFRDVDPVDALPGHGKGQCVD